MQPTPLGRGSAAEFEARKTARNARRLRLAGRLWLLVTLPPVLILIVVSLFTVPGIGTVLVVVLFFPIMIVAGVLEHYRWKLQRPSLDLGICPGCDVSGVLLRDDLGRISCPTCRVVYDATGKTIGPLRKYDPGGTGGQRTTSA